jgi:hypothetical protein
MLPYFKYATHMILSLLGGKNKAKETAPKEKVWGGGYNVAVASL